MATADASPVLRSQQPPVRTSVVLAETLALGVAVLEGVSEAVGVGVEHVTCMKRACSDSATDVGSGDEWVSCRGGRCGTRAKAGALGGLRQPARRRSGGPGARWLRKAARHRHAIRLQVARILTFVPADRQRRVQVDELNTHGAPRQRDDSEKPRGCRRNAHRTTSHPNTVRRPASPGPQ
jgi:hypothetical protein